MPQYRTKKTGEVYIQYSTDEVQLAKSINIMDFLGSEYGWTFKSVGSYYQCREHDSLMIKNDCRQWWWNSRGQHGRNVIDWLTSVEMLSFTQCLEKLIGTPQKSPSESISNRYSKVSEIIPEVKEKKEFVLPPVSKEPCRRTFAYLGKTRCLDAGIISQLIKEKKIYEDTDNNVIFVGYDEDGKARFAESKMTNTYLANLKDENGKKKFHPKNVSGSDKRYSFNVPADKERYPSGNTVLYVFEAPIDLLSHCTMSLISEQRRAAAENRIPDESAWKNVNRLSLSGKSDVALKSYLERNPHITQIVFALDNDSAGIEAANTFKERYSEKGYICKRIIPKMGKDFNECLQLLTAQNSDYRQINISEKSNSATNTISSVRRR